MDSGERHEVAAFVGERSELTASFVLGLLFLLQLQARRLEVGFNRCHASFGRLARAHGSLICGDEQAQILPTLDELAERTRRNQRVDVAKVAVFVDIDQTVLEQIVVQPQGPLRSLELNRIPGDAALRRCLLGRERIDPSVHLVDRSVGLVELVLEIVVVQGCRAKLGAFGVQTHLYRLRFGPLRGDPLLECRPARRGASR